MNKNIYEALAVLIEVGITNELLAMEEEREEQVDMND